METRSSRLPPGQKPTTTFPVLHYGDVPRIALDRWTLRLFGLVDEPAEWTLSEFMVLPRRTFVNDIHCVTTWSRLDNVWEGIPVAEVMRHVKLNPEACYVLVHAEGGWTTNLPLADFLDDTVFFATHWNNQPLTPEHGAPVRLVVPKLYFWKSAKWVRGVEFMERDKPGFWEKAGYHLRGDPWKEERYRDDPEWFTGKG